MTLPELAASLIMVFEGCKLEAYKDPGGIFTIGIGHTKGVFAGQTITLSQAQQFFAEDCAPLLKMVEDRPMLEAAALASFGYNCGAGALQRVLGGHATLLNFTKDAAGHELPGLVSRRTLEENLILTSQQLSAKP